MSHRARRIISAALGAVTALAASALGAGPAAGAPVRATAHLGVALGVPFQHRSFAGAHDVDAPIDAGTQLNCVVTDHGPDALHHLRVQVRLQSTTLRLWRVAQYAKGPAITSGAVFDLGTVEVGRHKTLVLTVTPSTIGASTEAVGCTPISAGGVRLIRPRVDHDGDAVAARLHVTKY